VGAEGGWHAGLLAELEEKQAKFAAEVEKAGLQEKSDAKKTKRLPDSAESLKRGMGKVKEKAPVAIEATARRRVEPQSSARLPWS
jgi:hypothetical protein